MRGLDPFKTKYALEFQFGKDAAGLFIRETGFDDDLIAAPLDKLTQEDLSAAFRQMYPEWTEE